MIDANQYSQLINCWLFIQYDIKPDISLIDGSALKFHPGLNES